LPYKPEQFWFSFDSKIKVTLTGLLLHNGDQLILEFTFVYVLEAQTEVAAEVLEVGKPRDVV
jgi:hypothetical protein